jgi:hypothetical protein
MGSYSKYSVKDLAWATVITVIPVMVVLLMQKPALRAALAMRGWRAVRQVSQVQADFWQGLAGKASTQYWKATL